MSRTRRSVIAPGRHTQRRRAAASASRELPEARVRAETLHADPHAGGAGTAVRVRAGRRRAAQTPTRRRACAGAQAAASPGGRTGRPRHQEAAGERLGGRRAALGRQRARRGREQQQRAWRGRARRGRDAHKESQVAALPERRGAGVPESRGSRAARLQGLPLHVTQAPPRGEHGRTGIPRGACAPLSSEVESAQVRAICTPQDGRAGV